MIDVIHSKRNPVQFMIEQIDHSPVPRNSEWIYNIRKGCYERITRVWGKFRRATHEEQNKCSTLIFAIFDSPNYKAFFYDPKECLNSIKAQIS